MALAHPNHRVDLALVPADPDAPPARTSFTRLLESLREREVIGGDGLASGAAGWLVAGGFRSARLDEPGSLTLYANQQGGFRVQCPACGQNAAPAFRDAVALWRGGGERALRCGHCDRRTALEDLDFRPPAAFGLRALLLVDVETAALTPAGLALVHDHLGPVRVIARRVS